MPVLQITLGQSSIAGIKPVNQDYVGFAIPKNQANPLKGMVVAVADGISSSQVSQHASQAAIEGFIADYYSTPDSWTVKKSAQQSLTAMNSWLYAQTRHSDHRYDIEKGYVCTFSSIIFKSRTAHLFHVGDSRIYRLNSQGWELLTQDHRLTVARDVSYLNRALGFTEHLDLDCYELALNVGDIFLLMTDGAYEALDARQVKQTLAQYDDLDKVAHQLTAEAQANGSTDNISVQIVRVDALPDSNIEESLDQALNQPFPQPLNPPCRFDGLEILREIHSNHRSHVYLAKEPQGDERFVVKIPSVEQKEDHLFIERFVLEEWVAKRINHPHVAKAYCPTCAKSYLYTTMQYIEGQTLAQWLRDNPKPALSEVRDIVAQIAKALHAFHRLEMIHQDVRPENIMIDDHGTVTLIDFGATHVEGLAEWYAEPESSAMLGTVLYSAPEYFISAPVSWRSDQFSLAVITYYLLSGRFPYGTEVAKARTRTSQMRLKYQSVTDDNRAIPEWLDEPLKKALQPDPYKRYAALSEFIHDLSMPGKSYQRRQKAPLMQRNPIKFWQIVSLIQFAFLVGSFIWQHR